MDDGLLREIHYLTRLIECHKKKAEDLNFTKRNLSNKNLNSTKTNVHVNLFDKAPLVSKRSINSLNMDVASTNVHINPNFKLQNSAIHINPKLQMKSLIHINPKMMKTVINTASKDAGSSSSATIIKQDSARVQSSVKKSVHVNPKLVKKLSSTISPKPTEHRQTDVKSISHPACSRLKFVKGANNLKVNSNQKKANNSSIMIVSTRKLIRMKRGSRKLSNSSQVELYKTKKSPNSMTKNIKPAQKIMKTKLINALQESIIKNCNIVKSPLTKPKMSKYSIDRTASNTNVKGQTELNPKKNVNKKMELITIGGIVYKSSKNQLVRRSYGIKKKRVTNVKSDKFIVATNGKKLCRVKSLKEIPQGTNTKPVNGSNGTKLLSSVSQKANYKTNISNKVKQRSLQILRNKMRKNNQPCLIFQRFGYCKNHENGICMKLHDKKQISLCKKFLQGNCLLDNCPLSHHVGPEKMPTCKYFLEGCCTRDACPYRHIKVSANTPICIEFLQGYCTKGDECKMRHENLCPEYEKTKKCSKGKNCPYPHKLNSSSNKVNDSSEKYKVPVRQTMPVAKDALYSNSEVKLRYYEQTDSLSKNIGKKRESIMNKVEASVHSDTLVEKPDKDDRSVEILEDDCASELPSDSKVSKRPPIGILPAYIPID